jgi:Integrase zinc binding domain
MPCTHLGLRCRRYPVRVMDRSQAAGVATVVKSTARRRAATYTAYMRIRLMRFDYSVTWQPGSQLFTADTVSRFPLENEPSMVDSSVIVNSLPITDMLIDKVLTASTTDDAIQTSSATAQPSGRTITIDHLPPAVKSYWPSRDNFTVQNGLHLHGARIVIPSWLRQETLTALQAGHLGVVKCRAKARRSVWRPKISTDIATFVAACRTWEHDRAEPMLSTPLPDLPWQKVATDLFEFRSRYYIVMVD